MSEQCVVCKKGQKPFLELQTCSHKICQECWFKGSRSCVCKFEIKIGGKST